MSNIRSQTLYVSAQLYRWLRWMAEMETPGEQTESFKATADSTAEKMLREYILEKYPDIQQLEAEYHTERSKLDEVAVKKLKQQKTNETEKQSKNMGRPSDS